MAKKIIIQIISVVVLFVNLSYGRKYMKVAEDIVQEICASTNDPTFCFKAIKSDPRTAAENLTGLAEICIDLAGAAAKKAEKLAATLIKTAADPQLKEKYRACSKNFAAARGRIGEAAKGLAAGNGKAVAEAGLDGLNEGEDCRDEFEAPPKDPSELAGLVGKLITLCGAVFFAAQYV